MIFFKAIYDKKQIFFFKIHALIDFLDKKSKKFFVKRCTKKLKLK